MSTPQKRLFLISLPYDDHEAKKKAKNFKRYMSGHQIPYQTFTSRDEIIHHFGIDDSARASGTDDDDEADTKFLDPKTEEFENDIINVNTNQELLENWAKSTFDQDSDEYNLLFGHHVIKKPRLLNSDPDYQLYAEEITLEDASSPNEENENEKNDNALKALFHNDDISILEDNEDEEEEDDHSESLQRQQECKICHKSIYGGLGSRTKLRSFALHVMEYHHSSTFAGIHLSQRYKCTGCTKIIAMYDTPCRHMHAYHLNDDKECEFIDLWSTEAKESFDSMLFSCFKRHLPVPRGRRKRQNDFIQKTSYTIRSGDVVTEKKTVDMNHPSTSSIENNSIFYTQNQEDNYDDVIGEDDDDDEEEQCILLEDE